MSAEIRLSANQSHSTRAADNLAGAAFSVPEDMKQKEH
jgi:hypothetical protein